MIATWGQLVHQLQRMRPFAEELVRLSLLYLNAMEEKKREKLNKNKRDEQDARDQAEFDKLAEIAYGTTEFVIDGDYEYIGLRSGSGAMYLNSIEITWVTEEVEETESYILSVSNAGWATLFLDFNAAIPADVDALPDRRSHRLRARCPSDADSIR